MNIKINPKSFTEISSGSCIISSETTNTDLVSIYEEDKFIVDSYLNTPITILTNIGLKVKSHSKTINIKVTEI